MLLVHLNGCASDFSLLFIYWPVAFSGLVHATADCRGGALDLCCAPALWRHHAASSPLCYCSFPCAHLLLRVLQGTRTDFFAADLASACALKEGIRKGPRNDDERNVRTTRHRCRHHVITLHRVNVLPSTRFSYKFHLCSVCLSRLICISRSCATGQHCNASPTVAQFHSNAFPFTAPWGVLPHSFTCSAVD